MKKNLWPLFFTVIFGFTFGMIVWTIVQTSSVPVHEDKSFLLKYQYVEENFNNIVESNKEFAKLYDLDIDINKQTFGLSIEDLKYSQKVLEKKSNHKNLLKVGENSLSLFVTDKKSGKKQKIDISFFITKSISDDKDMTLKTDDFKNSNDIYSTSINIPQEGNWNIMATLKIEDKSAYFFIKTNAIKK